MSVLESRKPLLGWKRFALNLFIGFHLLALALWGLPDTAFRNRMANPFERYVVYTGFWHIWGMFAPGPLNVHYDIRAQVKYKDGSTNEWICPRMQEFSVWERVPKERYRKWRERIHGEDFRMVWPDTARYVARVMNTNPTNPPVEVKLVRHWINIPPPDLSQDYQPMPKGFTPTNAFVYHRSAIRPQDLQ
jgi:hypothetical protein